ncbi:hypothetical protein LEP1GSC132_2989 [Leptospira kirschneri str. 200803703]|uniref:Uncharacterized protein n=1 Tax=Leptospira kirschneri str. 200802841 TaxID=1193047 RepID=A0A828XS21_9LEPT|nr:hypothetical protein LEP1GSC131_0978 [Leptospira kirschneri str. 200802841]EMO67737.1 hypothetical protein LEP1GSC132_2989 [Leptospira kirschneri str. 200803703]EPG50636.1 hypothetical protein LEP1GSC049_3372 [Leptospira kirschneri serovar Cynopteri str. 3522 CT]
MFCNNETTLGNSFQFERILGRNPIKFQLDPRETRNLSNIKFRKNSELQDDGTCYYGSLSN